MYQLYPFSPGWRAKRANQTNGISRLIEGIHQKLKFYYNAIAVVKDLQLTCKTIDAHCIIWELNNKSRAIKQHHPRVTNVIEVAPLLCRPAPHRGGGLCSGFVRRETAVGFVKTFCSV